jgi:GH25 family lysozyme M1 (1,4-beta-N-acetylmuramidase)
MIQGADVHAGYGKIAWEKAAAVLRFVYVKCTTGNSPGVDAQFAANVSGAIAHDVAVGGYHFSYPLPDDAAHPGRSPEEQAERAFRDSRGLGSREGELPHAIDAEWPPPQECDDYVGRDKVDKGWKCTRPQMSEWFRRYCVHATKLWGRKPIIYTYPAWWRWLAEGADVSWAREYEVWFADYAHPGPGTPPDGWVAPHMPWVAGTWDDFTICQYSAEGSGERIPGIAACPVDRDCIRDEETLRRLTSHGVSASVEPGQLLPDAETVHPRVPLER